jgi:hypothetical protein
MSDFKLPFDGTILSDPNCAKNLGVFFHKTLSMAQQFSAIAKSCYHQIRNIGHIISYITENAYKTLVCSLVTSRLGNDHLTWRLCFFSKKSILIPNVAEKNILILVEEKK